MEALLTGAPAASVCDTAQTRNILYKDAAMRWVIVFFFQAEDGIRDYKVTGVQTCALPISTARGPAGRSRRPCPGLPAPPGHSRRVFGRDGAGGHAGRPRHTAAAGRTRRTEKGRVGEKGGIRGWAAHLKKKKRVEYRAAW